MNEIAANTIPETATPAAEKFVPKPVSRFAQIKPFLAPILITLILWGGNLEYRVLQSHWHTLLAIAVSIGFEIILSYFATGRFPHIASAYITGISVGIILQTPAYWPYAICSMLACSSKYALRVKGRHLWNPSNLGVSLLLFLVPQVVAPLGQQWGNEIWPSVLILSFGSIILFTVGRLQITVTYICAFIVLAFVRANITGVRDPMDTAWNEISALLTSPAYQLFMIFMITDPKTTTRTWPRQCTVAVIVAIVESVFRLNQETHAPYYALFLTAPVTNLIEIWWDGRCKENPNETK